MSLQSIFLKIFNHCIAQSAAQYTPPPPPPGGRGSRKVWVKMCRRGLQTPTLFKTKIAHFATLFKTGDTTFWPSHLFCFAYKIIGISNVERSCQVLQSLKGFQSKKTPFSRLKTLKTIPWSAAHSRIGQIRECPPFPNGMYPRSRGDLVYWKMITQPFSGRFEMPFLSAIVIQWPHRRMVP